MGGEILRESSERVRERRSGVWCMVESREIGVVVLWAIEIGLRDGWLRNLIVGA